MMIYPISRGFSLFWLLSGIIMLVPHFVLTFFLKKRKLFVLRTIVGVLLYAFAAYLTCFTDQWHERYYLLLHLAAALYLAFCCKCSLKMTVYFNIWCIVLYYFIFQIHSLINAIIDAGNNIVIGYTNKFIAVLCLVALELLLIRILKTKDIINLSSSQVLISALISLAIIAFNTITFEISPKVGYTRYIFQIFSMLCNLLAMYIQVVAYYSQKKSIESEYIKHMLRVSKKDQENKYEYIDMINHKYHDLKHEIRALRQLDGAERNEYLDKLEHEVDQFNNLFETGNKLLDAVLNDVRRRCDKDNIMFSCIADCSNSDFIDIVDLSILLGNILDNAIEAASLLPQENRVIDLKLHSDVHFFRITEKNTFSGTLNITDDGLISSKPENGYHGFGSQSIKYIVDKYNGQLALDAEEGIFSMHVIIPVPN